jgi:hypothetical protein
VKSRVSGPFGNEEFGRIMTSLNRLHAFLFVGNDVESIDNNWDEEKEDSTACYQGSFQEKDLDGVEYTCKHLWSVDVATKWIAGQGAHSSTFASQFNTHHQDLLRSCNFQAVLGEALYMDNDIALKGSICTDREKYESQRRLTLVKRAFLSLLIAFTSSNKQNQELIFSHMPTLEKLAVPDNMRSSDFQCASEISYSTSAWPSTVSDLSQALILSILRKNATLCDQVSPTLMHLFASIADHSVDPSISPALELMFILVKPEVMKRAVIILILRIFKQTPKMW